MKQLLFLLLVLSSCRTFKKLPKTEPLPPLTPKIDTVYVTNTSPPIIKRDTLPGTVLIEYQDTTICPADTVERIIIQTKTLPGKVITITKTVPPDTIRITEKIPSIECPEVNPSNLLWKIVTGFISLLFLIIAFIKKKKE